MENEREKQQESELKKEIKFLDKRYADAIGFFKLTLSLITGIIVVLSIIIAFVSIVSKKEITQAIRDMERKFELLSDQALKLPRLEIFYDDKLVSNKKIPIPANERECYFHKLFIKNEGEKIARDITIKLYTSLNLGNIPIQGFPTFNPKNSVYTDYSLEYKYEYPINLSPQEPWPFPRIDYYSRTCADGRLAYQALLKTPMKVEVYGMEKPVCVEIEFVIENELK